jgi:23S rRNA (cytosine1962-C5)-methyltransferase
MPGYALIDAGDGRRLERFGERLVDRPAPAATWPRRAAAAWSATDARFDRGPDGDARWDVRAGGGPWIVETDGLRLELRFAAGGQVGLFPEHLAQAGWLRARLAAARDPAVLHLFAYTGALTLVAALAGASVAHVDASRPAVAWARRNAALSEASACPIRWLVDDAEAFVRREARRGRRYAGAIVDPPSYGHGADGRRWRLEDRIDPLLDAVAELLDGPHQFVLLTAHTPGFGPGVLAERLQAAVGPAGSVDAGDLALTAESGVRLPLGAFARWSSEPATS